MCSACGFANPFEFRFAAVTAENRSKPLRAETSLTSGRKPNADSSLSSSVIWSARALLDAAGPRRLRDLILAYQTACTSVIQRYDGTVSRYAGDGILALFGYPRAHEDDAERAVRAGLGIVSAIATLPVRGGIEPLAVRVGIATGVVVVGDLIGEGRPKRRQSLAKPPTSLRGCRRWRRRTRS